MATTKTLQHPSGAAVKTTNKNWSITNNTDTGLVVIAASGDDDLPVEQLYEQSLQLLKTTGAQDFIQAGDTASLAVEPATGKKSYSIIIARADNLFPVKIMSAMPDSQTQSYPPVTVTAGDVSNMNLAAKFRQTITAFPSSGLASDFSAAVSDKDVTKVDAFFNATDDYKSLTLDMVVAVDTYYTVYPFVWADYKESKTYYLYTSDGTANTYLGSVSLSNQSTAPVSPDQEIAGFTITYKKAAKSSQPIPLYYVHGKFVDDKDSDNPAVSLQGLFILKSQLSLNEADKSIIITLNGTVDDDQVIGTEEEQKKDSHGNWLGLYGLLHPKDTVGWIELAGIALGILVGIGVLCKSLKVAIEAIRRLKSNPADADALNRRVQSEEEIRAEQQVMEVNFMAQAKAKIMPLIQKNNIDFLNDLVEKQRAYVQKMAKYGVDDGMQEVLDSFEQMQTDIARINETPAADMAELMDGLVQRVHANSTILNDRATDVKREASAQESESMDRSKEIIDRTTARLEDSERQRREWEEDEVPEEIEPVEILEG